MIGGQLIECQFGASVRDEVSDEILGCDDSLGVHARLDFRILLLSN